MPTGSRWEYVSVIDRNGKSIRNDLYHLPEESESYMIWKEGDKICAKNGHTGQKEFEDDDAEAVIDSALDSLTSGRTWKEKVVLKGDFTVGDTISIPSYTIFEVLGRIKLSDGVNKNVISADGVQDFEIIIHGTIDGNKTNQSGGGHIGVNVYNCHDFLFEGYIENCDGIGLAVSKSNSFSVPYVFTSENNEAGVLFQESYDGFVDQLLSQNNLNDGLKMQESCHDLFFGRAKVTGNSWHGCTFAGKPTYTESYMVTFDTLISLLNTQNGMTIDNGHDIFVNKGIFKNNGQGKQGDELQCGVLIQDGGNTPYARDIHLSNCKFWDDQATPTQLTGVKSIESTDFVYLINNDYRGMTTPYSLVGINNRLASRTFWLSSSVNKVSDLDRTTTLDWTDLDLSGETSKTARYAILLVRIHVDTSPAATYNAVVELRRKGDTPADHPRIWVMPHNDAGDWITQQVIIGLDTSQTCQYRIGVGDGQIDSYVDLLGYVEEG